MGSSTSAQDSPWTRGHNSDPDSDSIKRTNRVTFDRLKQNPKFSEFFTFTFPDLKVGKKFAEGSHAQIYEGEFTLGMQTKFPCVLKIFRDVSSSLTEIQEQWPEGMLKGGNSVFPGYFSGTSSILGGVLLEDKRFDERFAMVLRREWGDLRKLIDLRMERVGMGGRPFSDRCAKKMMLEIAMGMRQLHNHGIVHRDLKSLNVLVCFAYAGYTENIEDDAFTLKVFDFESSIGVVGTAFWRAPEILQALLERTDSSLVSSLFVSTKSDAYAYAMTCYEILTGKIPFEEVGVYPYDIILLEGRRPELPQVMDEWLRELIQNCWHQDPSQRPTFDDIVNVFKANFSDPRIHTVEEQIAASKFYWTARDDDVLECERNETNQEAFARLKKDPQYSSFFSYPFHNLEPKLKIAQGGQAEIFGAEFEKDNGIKVPCVLKIFDSRFSLSDMIRQWPPGMFRRGAANAQRFGFMGLYPGATRTCEVLGAVVLEKSEKFGDGFADRFAFIFNREGGDLRTLIDLRMKQRNNRGPPFTIKFATKVMHEIALGMQHLHDHDILHRDLKAANVLVTDVFGEFPTDVNTELMDVKVADFECSMVVDGTKFWRAPEILRQLKPGEERTYTGKADVYSYGMTCYEVLTGGVPLEDRGFKTRDYEAVYRGERPILPEHIDGWLRALIERCWDSEPSERPEFKEIIEELESNCSHLKQSEYNLEVDDTDSEGDSEEGSEEGSIGGPVLPDYTDG